MVCTARGHLHDFRCFSMFKSYQTYKIYAMITASHVGCAVSQVWLLNNYSIFLRLCHISDSMTFYILRLLAFILLKGYNVIISSRLPFFFHTNNYYNNLYLSIDAGFITAIGGDKLLSRIKANESATYRIRKLTTCYLC